MLTATKPQLPTLDASQLQAGSQFSVVMPSELTDYAYTVTVSHDSKHVLACLTDEHGRKIHYINSVISIDSENGTGSAKTHASLNAQSIGILHHEDLEVGFEKELKLLQLTKLVALNIQSNEQALITASIEIERNQRREEEMSALKAKQSADRKIAEFKLTHERIDPQRVKRITESMITKAKLSSTSKSAKKLGILNCRGISSSIMIQCENARIGVKWQLTRGSRVSDIDEAKAIDLIGKSWTEKTKTCFY